MMFILLVLSGIAGVIVGGIVVAALVVAAIEHAVGRGLNL